MEVFAEGMVAEGAKCSWWLCLDESGAVALEEHLSAYDRWADEVETMCGAAPVDTIEANEAK